MENELPLNRVEMEVNRWRSKEERFSKLFSFGLSGNRALMKEKLGYFEQVSAKYKNTENLDERFALRLLNQERKAIEKQLYPNLFVRLLRRLFVTPAKEQIIIRQDARQLHQNSQALQKELQRTGFSALQAKVEQQLKLGSDKFSVPLSHYVNEKQRLSHQLSFERDVTGAINFKGYTTSLVNELKPEENKQHYFSNTSGKAMDADKAYNLLSGRAVLDKGIWKQLDLNDKDGKGDYRLKEFHSAYGYDLEKLIRELPLREGMTKQQTDKLKDSLEQGRRASVTFVKDGKEQMYFIEANPQFKSVNIYDEHSRKITLATAAGGKAMEAAMKVHKQDEGEKQTPANRKNIRIS